MERSWDRGSALLKPASPSRAELRPPRGGTVRGEALLCRRETSLALGAGRRSGVDHTRQDSSLPFSRKLALRAARLCRVFVPQESLCSALCRPSPRPALFSPWTGRSLLRSPCPSASGLYALLWAVMGTQADVVSGCGSWPSSAAGQRVALQGGSCPMRWEWGPAGSGVGRGEQATWGPSDS